MVSGEFSLDSDSLTRGLWQLKEAGWFDTAKGFVFGRPCMFESFTDHTYVGSYRGNFIRTACANCV